MRHIILLVIVTTLFSCGQTNTKEKELELKEKELTLKEKELNLKEKALQADTIKEKNKQTALLSTKNSDKKEINKAKLDLSKFAGSWHGDEADLILIKVNGKSVIVYSDYDNDKAILYKGTAIDNSSFETSSYNGEAKGIKSIWRLNGSRITITTNGKRVYGYQRN